MNTDDLRRNVTLLFDSWKTDSWFRYCWDLIQVMASCNVHRLTQFWSTSNEYLLTVVQFPLYSPISFTEKATVTLIRICMNHPYCIDCMFGFFALRNSLVDKDMRRMDLMADSVKLIDECLRNSYSNSGSNSSMNSTKSILTYFITHDL
ncbi:hypothetical protein L2E82_22969 [Cichorium intybus]|uniref:Uncharacterized protein n=1 Tax=Cichorium intybus TaxID=13427 RepID=A0ACB9DZY4_CICIN|nr:hypothetical protein L2E82_22969 [Cichorium intybus]